ncbi:Phosphoglycerate kinase [Spironucleus salmonicida]|uniref:Phosphoglycerate kinase n=1 Tax=Spironucleus salmonicida TaxID=348837 RepID=V6LVR5_9EUKA|nr:Phosphoglycerate kinase [Spironucleus salmonicida]|eukprot:EST48717.1 Phosphoglycerate kinase [Spironucleus salmonicida]
MDFNKLSIKDVDVKDKAVFIRVDYNVPQDDAGVITNTARIDASIPTIQHVLNSHPKYIVLCSHLGRPKGTGFEQKFSMKPASEALAKILGKPVTQLEDVVGPKVEEALKNAKQGEIFMLENARFYKEETNENEQDETVKTFRKNLKALADIYCDDAFGTAHRPHSSMVGEGFDIRCAGFLLQKEIDYFKIALAEPKKPYLAILGGAKISDKTKLIHNLLPKVDKIILCGGMAYAFLKKQGMTIGNSLYDPKCDADVEIIIKKAAELKVEIILPIDFRCTQDFKNDAEMKIFTKEQGIPDGWEGLDAGPKSEEVFKKAVLDSKTIIWNGPAGVFEFANFAKATFAICDACVEATTKGAITIIGGGDSATAAKKAKAVDKLSHVSTGGGAALELLQGDILPGVARLSNK